MLGMTQQVTNMFPFLRPLIYPHLKAVHLTHANNQIPVSPSLWDAASKWLYIYFDLLEWHLISHPMVSAPLMSPIIGVFPITNEQNHHISVFIPGPNPAHFLAGQPPEEAFHLVLCQSSLPPFIPTHGHTLLASLTHPC